MFTNSLLGQCQSRQEGFVFVVQDGRFIQGDFTELSYSEPRRGDYTDLTFLFCLAGVFTLILDVYFIPLDMVHSP